MTSITIDPTRFPGLDIVALANSGRILRAERETPEGSLPAFVTAEDWALLLARFGDGRPDSAPAVLAGLEKASRRLLLHIAEAARTSGSTPTTSFCPSDLFTEAGHVLVAFVRDLTHPVACALIGTEDHVRAMLRGAA